MGHGGRRLEIDVIIESVEAVSGQTYTVEGLLLVLEDARSYIAPTISTHEEISDILGWCDCGYCTHVPNAKPS